MLFCLLNSLQALQRLADAGDLAHLQNGDGRRFRHDQGVQFRFQPGERLLGAAGIVTHLCFGSECGDLSMLEETAEKLFDPELDALLRDYPYAELEASGPAVGLAAGKTGNSEAGHNNLGAGRIVAQDDVRMDQAIQDGSFKRNPVFLHAIDAAREEGTALHLLAYLTEKSSHGCIDYPLMLTEMAEGVEQVYLHIIFDGRSTEPGSAPAMLRTLDKKLAKISRGVIVDGVGRGVALDRDKNYAKVRRAYDAMTIGTGTEYQA